MYTGFPHALLSLLRCPADEGSLRVTSGGEHRIRTGTLECQSCGAAYRVDDGIVDLVRADALDPESAHECRLRDEKARVFELPAPSAPPDPAAEERMRKEIAPTLAAVGQGRSRCVLELGCGKGAYTLALAGRCESMIAVDLSGECLRVVARLLGPDVPVGLVRADVARFATAPGSFDLIFSTLLSNLPGPELRAALFRMSRKAITEGGRFLCGVHHHSVRDRLRGVAQADRYTPGGIFRYSFRRGEILNEARPYFARVETHPLHVGVPLVDRIGLPPAVADWLAARRLIGYATAQLLLLSAGARR